jgi:hypothetical protein
MGERDILGGTGPKAQPELTARSEPQRSGSPNQLASGGRSRFTSVDGYWARLAHAQRAHDDVDGVGELRAELLLTPAAAPGIVPRCREFRQKQRNINMFRNLGV